MDRELKHDLKKLGQRAEVRLARSLLRWRRRRKGEPLLEEPAMDEQSEKVAEKAHDAITRAGKSLWSEVKQVYFPDQKGKDKR